MEDEYIYTVIQYFALTFLLKPILDIILNYFINRFKDKKNNLLLFYNVTFGLYFLLLEFTNFNFLPRIKRHIDFADFIVVFFLLIIIDLIVTAIYFKKNKKTFITFLSIALSLFVLYIIYTYMNDCSGLCEIFLDVNDYILIMTSFILFIIKAIFSAIYTVYLIFKLGVKIKNDIKNKRI